MTEIERRSGSTLRSLLMVGLVAVVLLGSLGWLARQCRQSPNLAFLDADAPSRWILYPSMDYIGSKRLIPGVHTVFRKHFTLDEVPKSCHLHFRALRDCRIDLNGNMLSARGAATDANWRLTKQVDAKSALKVGDNVLTVTVLNEKGPPALALSLDGPGLRIEADDTWIASYAGAADKTAAYASEPRPGWRLPDDSIPPTTVSAVRNSLPYLALFAVISMSAVVFGAKHLLQDPQFGRLRWVAVLFLAALFLNDFQYLNYNVGFDSLDHIHYIKLIQAKHALPSASDGRETHQPPLFYLACAGILELGRLQPTSTAGLFLLRCFTMSLGVMQFLCITGSLKLVFPEDRPKQLLGGIFAAVLPMHLFIFQYITNESLIAALSAAVIYFTLRLLERPTKKDAIFLGCLLGAAFWTKISAFGLAPVVFASLAWAQFSRTNGPRPGVPSVALAASIALLIAAPFYLHVYREHHTLFVRHVDMEGSVGGRHWKDPGVRTLADYTRFGEVLEKPYFAGFHSFADAIYSTYWGDGRLGGKGASDFAPPWNMNLMTAGYLLALLPSIAILLGLVLAIVRFLKEASGVWMLLLGIAYVFLFAVLYESIRNPYLHSTKAWYGVPAATSISVFLALGMDCLATQISLVRKTVFTGFGAWALTAALSLWSPSGAASLESLGAAWNDDNRNYEASKVFSDAVKLAPNDASLRWRIGRLFRQINKLDHAESNLLASIAADPNFTPARYELADLLLATDRIDEAASMLADAGKQGIDVESGRSIAGDLMAKQGRFAEAVAEYREALSRWPTTPQLHAKLADAYEKIGDKDSAEKHRRYAVTRSSSRKESRKIEERKP